MDQMRRVDEIIVDQKELDHTGKPIMNIMSVAVASYKCNLWLSPWIIFNIYHLGFLIFNILILVDVPQNAGARHEAGADAG